MNSSRGYLRLKCRVHCDGEVLKSNFEQSGISEFQISGFAISEFRNFGIRTDFESGSVVRSVDRMADVTKKPSKINKLT